MGSFGSASGSPVLARQNVTQWVGIIFLIVIIIGLLFALAVVYSVLKQHSSAEWASKQKKKPTRLKNINAVANKYQLTKEDKYLLYSICRSQSAPNIEYLIHEQEKLIAIFRQYYSKHIKEKNSEVELENRFFVLLYKLEQADTVFKMITSTRSIPNGTDLIFTDAKGRCFSLKLIKHDKNALYVLPNELFMNLSDKPMDLEKITLYFSLSGDIKCRMQVRVIRYENDASGNNLLLLTHTNVITRLNRRNSKRKTINTNCIFSSVKVNVKKNKNKEEIEYIPNEKQYKGIIKDISSGGCTLQTSLPIKSDQYIWLKFAVDRYHTSSIIGITRKGERYMDSSNFLLHIRFVKISLATKNQIRAAIYDF